MMTSFAIRVAPTIGWKEWVKYMFAHDPLSWKSSIRWASQNPSVSLLNSPLLSLFNLRKLQNFFIYLDGLIYDFPHYILDSFINSKYELNSYFILHPTGSLSFKQLTTINIYYSNAFLKLQWEHLCYKAEDRHRCP